MAGQPVVISILADGKQARVELEQTATTAQKVGGAFRKMAAPALQALGAIGTAAKGAIDSATNLAEGMSKNEQIFGKQAGAIAKFAGSAEQSLGQSKVAALDAASTFGLIGQKAGMSGKESAGFAKQFTTLASDLASFNNTSPEEAVEAIGAAMRGEAEPIRKYGVMLDDATLRNEALKLGLVKTTKDALTPQQKALAASQAILAQTGKAQGDFARTSDGAANKGRILAAQSENLRATLGEQLLPVYESLQDALASTLGWISEHQTETKVLVGIAAGLAVGVLAVNVGMTLVTAATTAWSAVTMVATGVQTAYNAAMKANPVGVVVMAVAALAAGLVVAYKKSETFRAIVDGAFRAVQGAAAFAFGWVRDNWPLLVAIITGPIGVATYAVVKNWDRIRGGATAAKDWVVGKFDALVGFVTGLPGRIGRAASGMFDGIKDAFKSAINWVIDKWNGLSFGIPSIDTKIPGIGKIGGGKFQVPQIQRLATGGITTGPMLAMIGDNPGGREAVIPLDKYDLGGTTHIYVTVQAPVGSSPAEIGRTLRTYLNEWAATGGRRLAV